MEMGRKGSRGGRFVPRLEGLEDRTVPAGNVRVTVLDGTLYVSGDDQGNQVMVSATGRNSVIVRALDATTTVNGQSAVAVRGVTRDYYIDMFGGDDVLVLASTRNRGSLRADMGAGNDILLLNDAQHRKETTLRGGDGNDDIILGHSTFRRYVFADTGFGDDQVTAIQIGVVDFGLLNPSGNDFFNNQGSTFVRPVLAGFQQGVRPPSPAPPTDTTGPTPTLSTTAGAATNSSPIPFTVTFDEDVSGFDSGDLSMTNGTVSSFEQTDARTFRFRVAPSGQGVVTAQVVAGGITDAAGNANVESNAVSVTFDSTAPSAPQFNLSAGSDSGAVGDLRTDQSQVALSGAAEAGSTVQLFRVTATGTPGTGSTPLATTTATAGGTFTFTGVALAVGPNSFAVQATDAAGNASQTSAQTFTRNTPPTVANPIAPQAATAGGPDLTFDLAGVFADAEQVVRLAVSYPTGQAGSIDINLFADQAPQTVANFLAHVNSADPTINYDETATTTGTIFHRLAPGFVLQGGGFKFNDAGTTTATAFPTIDPTAAKVANEPGVSNTRGTVAMAKQGSDPNSVGTEFFFNLADNSANLDNQTGGFTAFGQVMNGGQQTVDVISGLATYSGSGIPGAPPFPIRPGADTTSFPANISTGDLAFVTDAAELTAAQRMTFEVIANTNPTVAAASVSGATLTISPDAAGTTTITIRATDLDGSSTATQVTITVT